MARSLLREMQIKDEHLLTEAEHDALDHAVISGTGVVSNLIELQDTPGEYQDSYYLKSTASGFEFEIPSGAASGYTGQITIVTDVTDDTITKGTMTFNNGVLTTYSGGVVEDLSPTLLIG